MVLVLEGKRRLAVDREQQITFAQAARGFALGNPFNYLQRAAVLVRSKLKRDRQLSKELREKVFGTRSRPARGKLAVTDKILAQE